MHFDFRKAFVCVHHLRLLQKLNNLGISSRFRSWMWSFLTKTTLQGKVGTGNSKYIKVTSEVPQGSVLFLLNACDCVDGLWCDVAMFTDNVKIWRTVEGSSDVQSLQNDINQLPAWSLWVSTQMNVSFLGCIVDKRRAVTDSINWTENFSGVYATNAI